MTLKVSEVFISAIFLTLWLSAYVHPQCSDAGVCAIGYAPHIEEKKHSFDLLYRYGNSGKEDKIAYHNFEFKAAFNVIDQTSLLLSFPFHRISNGPDGNANGVGDLMVFINQDLSNSTGLDLSVLLGIRLATGDANASPELPQAYQPGLGTNDIIFGLKYTAASYAISAGYQLVENTFTKNTLTPIRRADDFYLQFAYLFNLGDFEIKTDVQLIQRLAKTELKILDGTVSELEKTDQMQVNLGAEVNYGLNDTHSLLGGFAFPVLKRETNIDGLTRVLTIYAGWRLNL